MAVVLGCALLVIPPQPRLLRVGDSVTKTNYQEEAKWEEISVWAGDGGSDTKTYVIPAGWDYVTHVVDPRGKIGDASLNHSVNEDGKRVVSLSLTAQAKKRDTISFDGRASIGGALRVKIHRMNPVIVKTQATQADVTGYNQSLGIKTFGDKVKWRLENNPVVSVALLVFSAATAVLALWSQLLKIFEHKRSGTAA